MSTTELYKISENNLYLDAIYNFLKQIYYFSSNIRFVNLLSYYISLAYVLTHLAISLLFIKSFVICKISNKQNVTLQIIPILLASIILYLSHVLSYYLRFSE